MKHIDWDKIIAFIYVFITASIPFIVFGYIVLRIYVFFAYGSAPITEIPSWAFWIIGTGK